MYFEGSELNIIKRLFAKPFCCFIAIIEFWVKNELGRLSLHPLSANPAVAEELFKCV